MQNYKNLEERPAPLFKRSILRDFPVIAPPVLRVKRISILITPPALDLLSFVRVVRLQAMARRTQNL
jgi:hypothetical protein